MIWQVPFSQKAMLWILSSAFILGSGLLTVKKIWLENTGYTQIATAQDQHAILLKQMADSIMSAHAERLHTPVNLNTAGSKELERIKGIGPVLAANIVKYREMNGKFTSVDELDKVSGIGPKKLDALKIQCVIE